jgi:dihydroorotate dehydrogenase
MGIEFPNPVGLAAGFDKDGHCMDALLALGFGFIEVGTVTPRPQPGNPRPRLFRLTESAALINRLGFNNRGVGELLTRIQRSPPHGVLGINIGKNRDTPLARAVDDYRAALQQVYQVADYVTVNISSPNTPELRRLQFGDALELLLKALKAEQARLCDQHGRYVPLAVKVAPELSADDISSLAGSFCRQGVDGVIATNTTTTRPGLASTALSREQGGLSGAPLGQRSTRVLRGLVQSLQGEIPVIAVGGVMSADDALERFRIGADLVQIYTGLVFRGPTLIREITRAVCC